MLYELVHVRGPHNIRDFNKHINVSSFGPLLSAHLHLPPPQYIHCCYHMLLCKEQVC